LGSGLVGLELLDAECLLALAFLKGALDERDRVLIVGMKLTVA
jgi:hypothetical protein